MDDSDLVELCLKRLYPTLSLRREVPGILRVCGLLESDLGFASLYSFVNRLLLLCTALTIFGSSDTVIYESFDEAFQGRWIVSENDDYLGVWKHSKSEGHDDYGLLVSEKARKYAIVHELDKPLNLKDTTTILQFEARFQNGLECGGAFKIPSSTKHELEP
ncbi:hypothetical protein CTI12_AA061980 [Artemisia annua]|uniref:Calnexin n=1 Tax=Artemisia annua TaxID=35608 RepID=A0A2U1Q8S7_ARTAN|nr:hypothetical protein CTI12_AA061980 [Artemisia annua]